jgi:hypothetical protein
MTDVLVRLASEKNYTAGDALIFYGAKSSNVIFEKSTTDNPIESGEVLTDSTYIAPVVVDMTVQIANTVMVRDGFQIISDQVANVTNIVGAFSQERDSRVSDEIESLLNAFRDQNTLLTLHVGYTILDNMVLTKVEIGDGEGSTDGVEVNLSWKQIRLATSGATQISVTKENEKAGAKKDGGKVEGKDVAESDQLKVRSTLSKITTRIAG